MGSDSWFNLPRLAREELDPERFGVEKLDIPEGRGEFEFGFYAGCTTGYQWALDPPFGVVGSGS